MTTRIFGLLLLLLAMTSGAVEKINYFPRYKIARLTPEQVAAKVPAAIVPDAEIYEMTGSLLSDLRILNMADEAQPYLVEKMQQTGPVARLAPVSCRIEDTVRGEDGSITYLLALPQFTGNLARLEIVSNSRNFDRKVTVELLDRAERSWQMVAANRPVFDYSGTYEFRRTGLDFPPAGARRVRVTIRPFGEKEVSPVARLLDNAAAHAEENGVAGGRDGELNITELVLFQKVPVEKTLPAVREFKPALTRFEELHGDTVIGLETRRRPVERFEIQSDTPVFVRRVVVLAGPSPDKLRPVLEGSISRLLPDEQPVLELGSEMRFNCYEIQIKNNNRPPLASPTVTASGPVYQLVLMPPGDETLRIYFGADAPTPDYDVKPLLRRSGKTVYAALGPRLNNPAFRNAPAGFDTRTLLIGLAGVFILAALVLALKIFRPFDK